MWMPEEKMKLWTIQAPEVYDCLSEKGVYHVDDKYLFSRDLPNLQYLYDWLVAKMREKVGTPPQGVNYPIWAWHTREGKRKMPDLRQSGFGEKGTELVRMEIEIPVCFHSLNIYISYIFV